MTRLTRRYRFAASHRLHSRELSEADNRELYGKCSNPFGHGHNYILEVGVAGPIDPATGRVADPAALDRLVDEQVLQPFDHRNLNVEVPQFANTVPTTENLALEIGRRLCAGWRAAFPGDWPILDKVLIAETRKNRFELRISES